MLAPPRDTLPRVWVEADRRLDSSAELAGSPLSTECVFSPLQYLLRLVTTGPYSDCSDWQQSIFGASKLRATEPQEGVTSSYRLLSTNRVGLHAVVCGRYVTGTEWVTGGNNGSLCLWSQMKKKPACIVRDAHNGTEAAPVSRESAASWVQSVAVCRGSDLLVSRTALPWHVATISFSAQRLACCRQRLGELNAQGADSTMI